MHIFSVDVEDWFHILDLAGAPDLVTWDRLPSRVERNFHRLLELFALSQAKVTCFFLGWIGERFPDLVRTAAADGHEIASHGYAHRLVYEMTQADFREDAAHSRKLLEDIAGCEVVGYRAAGFSCTARIPWFYDELHAAGYRYDSSVFPAPRGHGGLPGAPQAPHQINTNRGTIVEFPITVLNLLGRPTCFFGGGYLRLFPMWLIRTMAKRVARQNRPVVFYVHPREIDPDHPRLSMSLQRRFRSYVNLRSTERKIRHILADFPLTTFRDYLATYTLTT